MTLCTLLWGMPPPRSDILEKTTHIKTFQTTFNASIWWKGLDVTYKESIQYFYSELKFWSRKITFWWNSQLLLAPFSALIKLDFHTDFGAFLHWIWRHFSTEFGALFSNWIWRQNRNWDLAPQNAYLMMKSLLLLASTTWMGGRFFPCSLGWVSANK